MDSITIQDNRKRGWFWADNVIIDVYLPRLGETAFAVYMTLCRHANNETHRALISLPRLAAKVGKSRMTVVRAVAKLRDEGLITVISGKRGDGLNEANVYQINDVGSLPDRSPVVLRSITHDTTVVSPVIPIKDSEQDSKEGGTKHFAETKPTALPRPLENTGEESVLPLRKGFLWITSTVSTETHAHLVRAENARPSCGASIKHRTTDPLKLAGKTPCPDCLEGAQKSKYVAPSTAIKDALAMLFFGRKDGLLPDSWKRIVKAWNEAGRPDLASCHRLEQAWYALDWRGKRRERPTPEQFVKARDSLWAGVSNRVPDPRPDVDCPHCGGGGVLVRGGYCDCAAGRWEASHDDQL